MGLGFGKGRAWGPGFPKKEFKGKPGPLRTLQPLPRPAYIQVIKRLLKGSGLRVASRVLGIRAKQRTKSAKQAR